MAEWLGFLLAVLGACLRTRRDLVAENLLLRHQLAVARRRRLRPPIRRRDKLRWVLARRLFRDWRRHLVVVRPDAVIRSHRRGWRLSPEVRDLIATTSRDNPRSPDR
jgi:hypothetical protein